MPPHLPRSLVFVLALIASACAGPASLAPPSKPAASPTLPPPTLASPSPAPIPTRAAQATDAVGCTETEGRLIQDELVHDELPRSLPYRVFVPPCAAETPGGLPTLYLLHGLARTDAQWDKLEADEVALRMVLEDLAPPFLIVMPWERRGLDYERTIVDYLIPYIQSEYGGSSERTLRSIGGISRGAGWALRIGLLHPDLFQAIGLHSPAVLVPDIFMIPEWLEEIAEDQLPEVWIDMGDRDPLRFALPALTDLLDQTELPYVLRSFPGEHTEAYWQEHVQDYLIWYVSGWLDHELNGRPQ